MLKLFFPLLCVLSFNLSAQPPTKQNQASPAFEVATVKANETGSYGSGSRFVDGKFIATNIQIRNLMQYNAFNIALPRIVGGPKWIESSRFDIEAKVDETTLQHMEEITRSERDEMIRMLVRQLLEDRFGLKFHWEVRQMPVYVLLFEKLGPNLSTAKSPRDPASMMAIPGDFEATSATMHEVANELTQDLTRELGRVVIDRTNLSGKFDMSLKWTPENTVISQSEPTNEGSIFTAVREQLGLKLESAKAPVEVLVIDHMDRPSAN